MRHLLLLISLMCAAATRGALEWKKEEFQLQVHPAQVNAEAVFEFRNTGSKPVAITDVIITCGCLSRKPYKSSYAPGESGSLTVVFNLLNREGMQRKHVLVETDDGNETDLTLIADIPVLYRAEPTLLTWNAGDTDSHKTIRLTNPNSDPVRLLSITCSRPDLPAELRTVREGYEYEVSVMRGPGVQNARAVIRITTEPPPGLAESKTVRLFVFAR